MKTETEIRRVLDGLGNVDEGVTKYQNMTYEQGISEAFCWLLGEIPDDEFLAVLE